MTIPAETSSAQTLFDKLIDSGLKAFDFADIYQAGQAEKTFGKYLKQSRIPRDSLFIQSKAGIRLDSSPKRYDFRAEYLIHTAEASLKRLQTDYLDAFLLHRPDLLMEEDEVARAWDHLQKSGKARIFGVSNFYAPSLERLQKNVSQTIAVNQLEISLLRHHLISETMLPGTFSGGTLDACLSQKIQIQAWSPLGGGFLSGRPSKDPKYLRVSQKIQTLAKEENVPVETLLIAWLLRHPAGIVPVLGSTRIQRIHNCLNARNYSMSRELWYTLLETIREAEVP